MDRYDALAAWKAILNGRKPLLSIEITKECPLRCPGCYAYDEAHLGGERTLRELSDEKGDELVARVLQIVDKCRPLHLSIVGGDPLVRYRELKVLLPRITARGVYVQLVTSAFREIPAEWALLPRFKLVVSIDGLPAEHDVRRKPATYERILKNIANHHVTVHCTVTSAMLSGDGYLRRFLDFWSARDEVQQIWMSIFTPQVGADSPEIPTAAQRQLFVEQMVALRPLFPKLDLEERTIRQFAQPPHSPEACIFAQVTETISADLTTRITPCQFGGNPDCSKCGCAASMGLNGLGSVKLAPGVSIGRLFTLSSAVGRGMNKLRAA